MGRDSDRVRGGGRLRLVRDRHGFARWRRRRGPARVPDGVRPERPAVRSTRARLPGTRVAVPTEHLLPRLDHDVRERRSLGRQHEARRLPGLLPERVPEDRRAVRDPRALVPGAGATMRVAVRVLVARRDVPQRRVGGRRRVRAASVVSCRRRRRRELSGRGRGRGSVVGLRLRGVARRGPVRGACHCAMEHGSRGVSHLWRQRRSVLRPGGTWPGRERGWPRPHEGTPRQARSKTHTEAPGSP